MGCVFAVSLLLPFLSFIQKLNVAVSFLLHRGCSSMAYVKVTNTSPSKFLVLGVSAGMRYRNESTKLLCAQRVVVFLTQMVSTKSPSLSVSLMLINRSLPGGMRVELMLLMVNEGLDWNVSFPQATINSTNSNAMNCFVMYLCCVSKLTDSS